MIAKAHGASFLVEKHIFFESNLIFLCAKSDYDEYKIEYNIL